MLIDRFLVFLHPQKIGLELWPLKALSHKDPLASTPQSRGNQNEWKL
jgi:hypothetical protein